MSARAAGRAARLRALVRWLLLALLAAYGAAMTAKNVRRLDEVPRERFENVDTPLAASNFACFYRGTLRLAQGEQVYFRHDLTALEEPSKQAPFFHVLLLPLLPLGPVWMLVLFVLGMAGAAVVAARALTDVLAGRGDPERRRRAWIAVLLGGALVAPALHLNFLHAQTGIYLLALFALALRWLPDRPFAAGLWLAVAIAVKVIPVVFVPWLAWRRQWRAVAGALCGVLLTTAAVFVATGPQRATTLFCDYYRMLRDDPAHGEYHERFLGVPNLIRATVAGEYRSEMIGRVRHEDWNGIRNFLGDSVLADRAEPLVLAASVLLLLACARACRPRAPFVPSRALAEGALVAAAMLLLSPHTWRHYYGWLWPAAAVAVLGAMAGERWAKWAIGALAAGVLLPHKGLLGPAFPWWQVFHGTTVCALVLFVLLARRLSRSDAMGGR